MSDTAPSLAPDASRTGYGKTPPHIASWYDWFFDQLKSHAALLGDRAAVAALNEAEVLFHDEDGAFRDSVDADKTIAAFDAGVARGTYGEIFLMRAALALREFAQKTHSYPRDLEYSQWQMMLNEMAWALASWPIARTSPAAATFKARFLNLWS